MTTRSTIADRTVDRTTDRRFALHALRTRMASAALAVLVTSAMLAGIDTLAVGDAAAPQMASAAGGTRG